MMKKQQKKQQKEEEKEGGFAELGALNPARKCEGFCSRDLGFGKKPFPATSTETE